MPGSFWYITSSCWAFMLSKFKSSLVIKSGRESTNYGVKLTGFEVNVKKWGRGNCFFYRSCLGYINGIQFAKFGLLLDITSSIYTKVGLKGLDATKVRLKRLDATKVRLKRLDATKVRLKGLISFCINSAILHQYKQ